MKNITLTICEQDIQNTINKITFSSIDDLTFLKHCDKYKFSYSVKYFDGISAKRSCRLAVNVYLITEHKIQIVLKEVVDAEYKKAVFESLIAYQGNKKLIIPFTHEVTYTFQN